MTKKLTLLGFASGIASNNVGCALGPWYLWYHPELFEGFTVPVEWQPMIQTSSPARGEAAWPQAEKNIAELASTVLTVVEQNQPFCVIGGDHSSAIGTWSAVAYAKRKIGDIGLIWIDAHMDSHTHLTSYTKNIHGMPLAHLLGHGLPALCHIFDTLPKVKPQHICLVGIRSYEPEEEALLTRLGVKIFFMSEIKERGIEVVMQEAYEHVAKNTCGVGVTIDLDAIDPTQAPGVGCPEADGIQGNKLVNALHQLAQQHPLLGLELAEFNPISDKEEKTALLLVDLIRAVYQK